LDLGINDINRIMVEITLWIIPVLLAVTMHEAAHGWVAWKLGDDTAKVLGRVTFNPLKHIDPYGTVVIPALLLLLSSGRFMFGFAKPVPVNFSRLGSPRWDMVLVAAAGPATNLLLAVLSAILIHLTPFLSGMLHDWVVQNLVNSMRINLLLCVFNMLPIPPLDGGRVAVGLLPASLGLRLARLEAAGMAIILGALFILPWVGGKLGMNLDIFGWLIGRPAQFLFGVIGNLTQIM
jgi:Zn-dependent protease